MGVARHFNGSGDCLFRAGNINSSQFTFAAWVKRDAVIAARNGLCGRLWDENSGWAFIVDEFNQLGLYVGGSGTNEFTSIPCPDIVTEWAFIGITRQSDATVRFYYGLTADTVALIGGPLTQTVGIGVLGSQGEMLGNVTFGSEAGITGWNGSMDQAGLWEVPLTLAELKLAAICGSVVRVSDSEFIAAITGDSPEPIVSGNVVPYPPLTVLGTTIITGFPVGCDFAPGEEEPPPPEAEEGEGQIRVTQARKWYAWRIGPVVPDAACVFIPVIRILRAVDFLPVMELDAYATCRYTRRWTDLDDFDLKFSCDTEQGLRLAQILKPSDGSKQNGKYLVAVAFFQLIDFVGWIDRIKCFKGGGRHEMTISGYGLDRILSDRVLAPGLGDEFDAYDDPVETIIKTMIDRHIKTPGTFTTMIPGFNEASREVPPLLIAADKELGPTVVYNGRFQKLIDGVREVIQSAEGELGYTLQLVNGIILFDVVPGMDKSLSVVFSPDYDNVSEFEWEHDGLNFCSQVVLGGQGTGTAKLLQSVYTTESLRFNIERREAYLDAADADTLVKLTDKGISYLEDKGKVEIVRIKKLPGSRPCYKEDWDLGDFVGLRDSQYGINQASRVMEVTVSCAAGQVTAFDLVLAKASPIGPLSQLSSLRQGATGAVGRQ